MFVASEDATSGSVIANADRISPASNGSSHCSFCSSVPNRCKVSMFPVSGAWQLIASGAITGDQPEISATAAYSKLLNPDNSGKKRFHRSRFFADTFSFSSTGGCACVSLLARHSSYSFSAGNTSSRMKSHIRAHVSSAFGESAKSISSTFLFGSDQTLFHDLKHLVVVTAEVLSGHSPCRRPRGNALGNHGGTHATGTPRRGIPECRTSSM